MQILITLFDYFRRKPETSQPELEMVLRPIKPTKVQKHQAKELAEAEMNLAQCQSNEEYYRFQTAFYRERIARLKGGEKTGLDDIEQGTSVHDRRKVSLSDHFVGGSA